MNNGLERAANRERLNKLEKTEVPHIWEAIELLKNRPVHVPAPVVEVIEGGPAPAFDMTAMYDIFAMK